MDTVSVLINDHYLGKNETVRSTVHCKPSDPNQASCTLALIERQSVNALFVFSNTRNFVVEAGDLLLSNILPVAADFECRLVDQNESLVDDISIQICNERITLSFLLPPGAQSQGFVQDVKRASESARNTVTYGNPQWNWLEKHVNRIEKRTGLSVHRMSNDEPEEDEVSLDTFMSTTSCASTLTPDDDKVSDASSLRNSPFPEEQIGSAHNSPFIRKTEDVAPAEEIEIPVQGNGTGGDLIDAPLGSCFGDNIIRRPGKMGRIDKRETYVNMNMIMREQDFTDLKTFTVFAGTWNVNGQMPTEALEGWLAVDQDPPDLYAVGFQELDLSKEAFLFAESPREAEWYGKVAKALHPKAKYSCVRQIRLVGMMLIVFTKEHLVDFIGEVVAESVGTGLMGKMGNKGGVAIRFKFHNTTICFVDSHLAAHTEQFERRNQDFKDINQRMEFSFDPESPDRTLNIESHDIVFWVGDLNYRIHESNLSPENIKELAKEERFEDLYKHDQLSQSREAKKCFHGYKEAPITFRPTYKYDPGTDDWDSSEKNRAPAWCDRVLWRCFGYYMRGTQRHAIIEDDDSAVVAPLAYRSHPTFKLSDHKPVSASFDIQVKVVNVEVRKKIFEDLMKRMDKLENEFLPQVELDSFELDFSIIKFMEPKLLQIGITNTGQIPVQYGFVNKPNDTHFCKRWLKIRNYSDIILPKEKSFVDVEVKVTPETASLFNAGRDALDDILVLHLENGKDIFITVKGRYRPSCFGASLDALVRMTSPISEYTESQIREFEKTSSVSASPDGVDSGNSVWLARSGTGFGQAYDIPKELWILVDHLYRYGREQKDLFQVKSSSPSTLRKIRDVLDSEIPERLPIEDVHAVAESLLLFLESLPDGVVPFAFLDRCLENGANASDAARTVLVLPLFHQNVFQYLMAFLRELLRWQGSNGLDKNFVATIFGEAILRSKGIVQGGKLIPQRQRAKKKMQFLMHFLENDSSYV